MPDWLAGAGAGATPGQTANFDNRNKMFIIPGVAKLLLNFGSI